jgi:hypothetical protein
LVILSKIKNTDWKRNETANIILLSGIVLFLLLFLFQYDLIDSLVDKDRIVLDQIQMRIIEDIATPSFVLYVFSSDLITFGMALKDWLIM